MPVVVCSKTLSNIAGWRLWRCETSLWYQQANCCRRYSVARCWLRLVIFFISTICMEIPENLICSHMQVFSCSFCVAAVIMPVIDVAVFTMGANLFWWPTCTCGSNYAKKHDPALACLPGPVALYVDVNLTCSTHRYWMRVFCVMCDWFQFCCTTVIMAVASHQLTGTALRCLSLISAFWVYIMNCIFL